MYFRDNVALVFLVNLICADSFIKIYDFMLMNYSWTYKNPMYFFNFRKYLYLNWSHIFYLQLLKWCPNSLPFFQKEIYIYYFCTIKSVNF